MLVLPQLCSNFNMLLSAELSVYGAKHMHTPNFDRLASRGVVFDAAYAQIAG